MNKYDNVVLDKIEQAEDTTRGHSMKLKKYRTGTSFGQKRFTFRVINNWNKLKPEVIQADTINSFKSKLNKIWRNKFKFI